MSTTLLPAIRSRVGDWMTYLTCMSFSDIEKLIKAPDEIHERKGLSDWIQREAIESHSDKIALYIKETPQRFLGSLIIGVYNGNPNWAPLNIKFTLNLLEVNKEQQANMEGKLGLLHLSGEEKLFAIDGQHRVSGIKKALAEIPCDDPIVTDEVSVIFVSHDESSEAGKLRTRRLFTTLNKKAKAISKSATIALDEDNGFAIITRLLIDQHWLFEDSRNHISYSSTGSISSKDESTITSVVGLYEIIKDLYYLNNSSKFESTRPSTEELDKYFSDINIFLNALLSQCSEFKEVFVDKTNCARYYREKNNHLLFRPAGQRAFARATQVLVKRGLNIDDAVTSLLKADLNLNSIHWRHILWNPISETMITNKLVMAETQLLQLCGHDAKSNRNKKNLEELLNSAR
ncbi:DNA sulfur modification protein DndB [Pseudoalteromonas sp. NZS37]|uniref:DNA sulfur modification protein DndB n=1 Tax=Pseudoalteromonas sp. NZS37 TaxID=2792071 RepID=UPI0018CDFA00|nr:DNA sulfur modification protein DndB [Pseudoalteromonas sp. NZS37]MBG9989651.1 DGQHR domain-containing protein [Pseudoalteromonas sp. NZS37]